MRKPRHVVEPWVPGQRLKDGDGVVWKVGAVMLTSGERYYMLIDEHGCVGLMPGIEVDNWIPSE